MDGEFHGEDEFAFLVGELPQPVQQCVVTGAAVADGEEFADDLSLGRNDADRVTALGGIDSDNEL